MAIAAEAIRSDIPDEPNRPDLTLVPPLDEQVEELVEPGEEARAITIRAFEALVQARLLYSMPAAEEDIPAIRDLERRSNDLLLQIDFEDEADQADLIMTAHGAPSPSAIHIAEQI